MDTFLNAGFGQTLGESWLERIGALGFAGIRPDIQPSSWEAVVDELGKFELFSPVFLFGGHDISGWTPELFFELTAETAKKIKLDKLFQGTTVYFEIGNEPDIAVIDWRQDPKYLADTFWECYRYVKAIHGEVELITGGISNLNDRGLDWLEEYLSYKVQNKAIIGFHRYPNGASNEIPHDGYPSREHEMNRLRSLTGDHRLFCTETGISTGPYRITKDFPLCFMKDTVILTDQQQADAFKVEWDFYRRRDIIGMVWYQRGDGPNRKKLLDNYGIFDINGKEKIICEVIKSKLVHVPSPS